jgi:uncharacterized protein (TIGR02597 family)
MKTSISYSLIAAAMACGLANGQTTAYTVPVGYLSIAVPADTDTPISAPLLRSAAWAGASTAVSGDTVSVAAASFTASQFGSGTNMLQVTSGPLIGRTFPVLSNATGSVTVDPVGSTTLQAQGFVATNTFVIRPYWTLNTLFPSGAGVGANSDPFAPSTLVMINNNASSGINRAPSSFYFYYDGSAGGDAGWYDSGNIDAGLQNDLALPPTFVPTIRNSTASPLALTISGEVQSVAAATLVISDTSSNDSFSQLSFPVDTSLDQSNLFGNGAVADSSDPFAPGDTLLVFNPSGTGQNPSPSGFYFHYDGSQGGDAGWYDAANLDAGPIGATTFLKAGSNIIIRKAGNGSGPVANTWTAPLPYSL